MITECERWTHPVYQKREEGDLPVQRGFLQLGAIEHELLVGDVSAVSYLVVQTRFVVIVIGRAVAWYWLVLTLM